LFKKKLLKITTHSQTNAIISYLVEDDEERAVRKVAESDKTRTAKNGSKEGQWFELIDLGKNQP
jgi:hypothetical protein